MDAASRYGRVWTAVRLQAEYSQELVSGACECIGRAGRPEGCCEQKRPELCEVFVSLAALSVLSKNLSTIF